MEGGSDENRVGPPDDASATPSSGPTDAVRIGEVLSEKYQIVRRIGAGGMGTVYQAYHVVLERRIAIKVLPLSLAKDAQIVARFLREGRAAARLRGEHVAHVHDIDRLPSGAPFLVIELLEGVDLAVAIRRKKLGITTVVDYTLEACQALAEAHAQGVVHRDIKPSNLFLSTRPDGTPSIKVLDFGIAKLDEPGEGLTATFATIGTVAYMSPEQIRATRDVDHRTDIWSLGITLFELLAGVRPFEGSTGPNLVLSIIESAPHSLAALRPDVPAALVAVAERCLEKDPDRRYQDVAELAKALLPFASAAGQRAAEPIPRLCGEAPIAPPAAEARQAAAPAPAPRTVVLASPSRPSYGSVPALPSSAAAPSHPEIAEPVVTSPSAALPRASTAWPIVAVAALFVVGVGASVAVIVATRSTHEGPPPDKRSGIVENGPASAAAASATSPAASAPPPIPAPPASSAVPSARPPPPRPKPTATVSDKREG